MNKIKICTLYFEGKYTPDYVEKLHNGLKKYCSLPFELQVSVFWFDFKWFIIDLDEIRFWFIFCVFFFISSFDLSFTSEIILDILLVIIFLIDCVDILY